MAAALFSVVDVALQLLFEDVEEHDKGEEYEWILLWVRDSETRIRGYVEDIVPFYPNHDFRNHFRLCRSTFEMVQKMEINTHSSKQRRKASNFS